MELKETYFDKNNIKIKTPMESNAACGKAPIINPSSVATPFPPLKPTYTGKTCPKTAATPYAREMFMNISVSEPNSL